MHYEWRNYFGYFDYMPSWARSSFISSTYSLLFIDVSGSSMWNGIGNFHWKRNVSLLYSNFARNFCFCIMSISLRADERSVFSLLVADFTSHSSWNARLSHLFLCLESWRWYSILKLSFSYLPHVTCSTTRRRVMLSCKRREKKYLYCSRKKKKK